MTVTDPRPRRWDAVVRLTHWSMGAAILANALVTEEGSGPHVWIGYALAAILCLRLIWGLVGPKAARFTSFPPSPGRAVAHIKDIVAGRKRVHASHNPLGALMVYAIWATLGVVIGSGIMMSGLPNMASLRAFPSSIAAPPPDAGAETEDHEASEGGDQGERGEREDGPASELHEAAVNILYLLIALHIMGVVFESRRSGRTIVMAMMPGAR